MLNYPMYGIQLPDGRQQNVWGRRSLEAKEMWEASEKKETDLQGRDRRVLSKRLLESIGGAPKIQDKGDGKNRRSLEENSIIVEGASCDTFCLAHEHGMVIHYYPDGALVT